MDYDRLTKEYWEKQQERVEDLRQKISAREVVGTGRQVPEDNSLSFGDGRRLDMAITFIDICGFSSRSMETLQEQDLTLRILNLFFTEMIRIAEEYDGFVEKNTGDGLMIYFKDQDGEPPESGVKRAVSCALTMMMANDQLINPIIKATPGAQEIKFRASIDYGTVTIAKLGAPQRFSANAAIGAAANFASKMLKHAKEGDIVLGEAARDKLPSVWKFLWTEEMPVHTGWHFRNNGQPYRLYRYTGRWRLL